MVQIGRLMGRCLIVELVDTLQRLFPVIPPAGGQLHEASTLVSGACHTPH